jgi:oligoendopeptidase F
VDTLKDDILCLRRTSELEPRVDFRKGDALVEPYLDLLRAGGSSPPEELAELVGLDLTDPAIWASGIDALGEDLDEAERLGAEIGLGAD